MLFLSLTPVVKSQPEVIHSIFPTFLLRFLLQLHSYPVIPVSANHIRLYSLSVRKSRQENPAPGIQPRRKFLTAWRFSHVPWMDQKETDRERHMWCMCLNGKSISEIWIKEKRKAKKRSRYHLTLRQTPVHLGASRTGYIIHGAQCTILMQCFCSEVGGKVL